MKRSRIRLIAVFAATMTLVLGSPGAAMASFGTPVEICKGSGAACSLGSIAVDSSGNAIVAWTRNDGTTEECCARVHARSIAANGTLGSTKTLSPAGFNAFDAEVAGNSSGQFTVVWTSFDDITTQVQARRIAADGSVGSIKTLADVEFGSPQVAVAPTGLATVVWERHDGTNYGIQYRTVAADGKLGSTKTLSAAGQDASNPQVVVDSTGRATVVWERFDGSSDVIQARPIAADGKLGSTKTLSKSGQEAFRSRVEVDSTGRVTVVWTRTDGADDRVLARAIGADGTPGPTITVSDHASSPAVAVDSSGRATIVWQGGDQVQARTLAVDGSLGSVQTLSNVVNPEQATRPDVAVDSTGAATVIWEISIDDYDDNGVETRTMAFDGTLGAIETLDTIGGDGHIVIDSSDRATAVWNQPFFSSYVKFAKSEP